MMSLYPVHNDWWGYFEVLDGTSPSSAARVNLATLLIPIYVILNQLRFSILVPILVDYKNTLKVLLGFKISHTLNKVYMTCRTY